MVGRFFWILLTVCFLVLTMFSGKKYWILKSPLRRRKLGEKLFPQGVSWIQEKPLEVVADLFRALFLADMVGFGLAMVGAFIDYFG